MVAVSLKKKLALRYCFPDRLVLLFPYLGIPYPSDFFKQKTAYEIVIGDWSSDVCSSDLRLS